MPPRIFPTRLLALASALALVSSCAGKPPIAARSRPPVDLFARPDRPEIPLEALTSEAAYEGWRDDDHDWGTAIAGVIDRACWWFVDAGYVLNCRPRPLPEKVNQ